MEQEHFEVGKGRGGRATGQNGTGGVGLAWATFERSHGS